MIPTREAVGERFMLDRMKSVLTSVSGPMVGGAFCTINVEAGQ